MVRSTSILALLCACALPAFALPAFARSPAVEPSIEESATGVGVTVTRDGDSWTADYVLDKDAPLVSQASLGGFGNGNTFPGTYDYLGRQLFVNLTADF